MSTDPAAIHGRSIALVRHVARGDVEAAEALLPALDVEDFGAQLVSVAQVAALLLKMIPDGDALMDDIALAIAAND